jgi:GNAT superfamily N-acetyltransferase
MATRQETGPSGDTTTRPILRPLALADLPAARALSAAQGWPHREEDWRFVLGLGEGVAAEQDGRLAGTALGWRYGPGFATLGLVIVSEAARGRGIGRALTTAVLDRLGSRTVLLNATSDGMPLYRSLGFAPGREIRQLQGASFSPPPVAPPPGHRLRPLAPGDGAKLAALDERATGMPRQALIAALLPVSEGLVLDRDGEAVGFALLRPFGRGLVIGPVVAPDEGGARALIAQGLSSRPGRFVRLDVPAETGLPGWLRGLGLEDAGPAMGMARGTPPRPEGKARSFALASQALG